MKDTRASILRGGAVSLVIKVTNAIIALALAVLLARTLGPDAYGLYSLAFALVSLLVITAQLGLPSLLVRETANTLAHEQWSLMRGVWSWSDRVALTVTFVLVAIAATVAWLLKERVATEAMHTFAWALALVPVLVLGNLRAAALRGLRRMTQGLLSEFVIRIGLLTIILGAVLWWGTGHLGAADAMRFHVVAAAIALLVASVWLWRGRPAPVPISSVSYQHSIWLRSAMPLGLVAVMQVINTKASILLLGLLGTASEVGVYQVAVSGANVVILGLSAANLVLAPRFASLYARGDATQLQRLVTYGARAVLVVTVPVAAVLIIFGDRLIELAFGAEYGAAHAPLAILVVGQVLNAAFGSVAVLLNMTHHERATARGMMIAAVANIGLNVALIPTFGVHGAALSAALSLVLWNVILWRAALRTLSINTLASAKIRPIV